MNRKNLILFAVIYLIILFISSVISVSVNSFLFKDNEDVIRLKATDFTNGKYDMSYRLLGKYDKKTQVFKANISGNKFKVSDDYKIIIYRFNSQGYKVLFNGCSIGSVGDFEEGRSNLWNSMNDFTIDRDMIEDTNELEIRALSLYSTGLSRLPILIVRDKKATFYMNIFEGTMQLINSFAIGFTFFGAITILILYFFSSRKEAGYIYIALALIFISIYALDYIKIYHLPFSYLTYKKIIMFSLYSSVAFVSISIYEYFRKVPNLIIAIVTITGYVPIAFVINNVVTFKKFYSYFNIIIILNVISWLLFSLTNIKYSDNAKIFSVGSIFIMLLSIYNVFVTLNGKFYDLITPAYYILTFLIIPVILIYKDFAEKNRRIEIETRKRLKIYENSIKDGMTGLYNHQYMLSILANLKPSYSIVMLDLDNFKEINDNFGHRIGDIILEHTAAKLKEYIRKSDIVCRYGGDEFVVILFDCSDIDAREIIEKVRNAVKVLPERIKHLDIEVTISAGIYQIDESEDRNIIIDNVDRALYHSKKNGKDRISIFPMTSAANVQV